MEQKICFFRPTKQEEREICNQPFIQCNSDYVPAFAESIIVFPYPFLECFLTGNGGSTCHELFIKKFNDDFDTAQRRLEECQKIVDQFVHIQESYEI